MFITRAFVTVVVMIGIAHSTFGEDQCGDFVGSDVVLNRERVTWYSEGFTGAGFPEISGTSKTCERTITSSKPFVVILHDVTKSNTWFLALVIDDGDPEEQNLVTGDERIITIATKVVVTYIQMATSAGDKFGISFLPTTPDDVCDGIKTIEATPTPKYITTENFPGYYEHNTVCQLTLTTTADYITAEIEWIKLAGQCGEDQLHVRLSPGSPRITLSCSDVISGARFTDVLEYKSIGKTMNIDFSSDFENSESGFRIKIYSNPYDTAPKVTMKCEVQAANANYPNGWIDVEFIAAPGTYGIHEFNLVTKNDDTGVYSKLDPQCGIGVDIGDDVHKIITKVGIQTLDPLTYTATPPFPGCTTGVEVKNIEGVEMFEFRASVRQIEGMSTNGDAVHSLNCNQDTKPTEEISSHVLAIVMPEYQSQSMTAEEAVLSVVHGTSLEPVTDAVLVGAKLKLQFLLKDSTWDTGKPVGAQLFSCTARQYQNEVEHPDQLIVPIIDEAGCAVSSKPFNVKGPFEPNPDAPGYKASYSTGVGLKYVAISGLFLAAGFIETNQVIFRCYYRFCDDPECFTNQCTGTERRKRQAESTQANSITAAIIIEDSVISYLFRPKADSSKHTSEKAEVENTTEECFLSWVFIVVVVVLVLLLVLAILISLCLVYQIRTTKTRSKQ